jgi:hypothetical protein
MSREEDARQLSMQWSAYGVAEARPPAGQVLAVTCAVVVALAVLVTVTVCVVAPRAVVVLVAVPAGAGVTVLCLD